MARKLSLKGDFLFGVGGVVTYKKSLLAEAVKEMALEDIVLETDCPYLTPVPHRGKRNESAYVKYVCEKVGAKSLFATHYHELTALEGKINGVKNYSIAVKKRGEDITFLRKIIRGGTDDSFGIEVARLAGVPDEV